MLILFYPEGRNILDLASILTSFSPEEQMPSCQCVCTAHLRSLLSFYPQVPSVGLGRPVSFREEFSEIPSLFWDWHQQLIEGKGEGEGLNIARKERKIKGRDKAQSFCKTERELCFEHHVSATWAELLPRRGPCIRHLQQGDIMAISIQSLKHSLAVGERRNIPAISPVFTSTERAEKFGYPLLMKL